MVFFSRSTFGSDGFPKPVSMVITKNDKVVYCRNWAEASKKR
jgi:hypothetical protein